MSVRRLADEAIQPESFAFTSENAAWAEAKIKQYPEGRQQSAVIPILMRAQEQDGWITRATIESVADMLDMPYIRVLEVATFYTQFQLQPVGSRAHVQVCGTTPCMLRGAEDIRAVCQKHIHAEPHHLNDDGKLSWEEVECAGACVNAPMVTIGKDTYEDLTPERFEEILVAFRDGKGDTIEPGPQNGRRYAMPLSGQVTLLNVPERHTHKDDGTSDKTNGTAPGRKRVVTEESAPAIEGPSEEAKVSTERAEKSKRKAAGSAKRKPDQAGREGATGSESAAVEPHGKRTAAPLFEAPAGTPDDLKLISGVGPVLEGKLHALGITKYAQVAAFTDDEIARVDDALSFKGRITRDNWVGQAKALAEGGVDEYVRVFGKKPR
ncbi:NADH-quinone oxidoreductase subunit NuoE [Pelagibacterium xiamenense]|uniref:NADH-quinone oxidoreductase subunit NuoE n=1 Tax=Pelagibacterium xiamenense TaxID=2901140 RepID=UPI001E2FFF1D|nr:NADH-quinone oxidoreductase subunit NuoE [Pelagibacterium xiamenense]MCD7060902.1 NADH-quinone oxidoreductase subunit NuoE [Pelagibacterium xiamenense]